MFEIVATTALIAGLALVVWLAQRARHALQKSEEPRAVVSGEDADASLYPYVFVSDRGSVRALNASEKQLLETPFHPLDAGRPYVKTTYEQKNRRGGLSGYCLRSEIPRRTAIGYPPIELPSHARRIPRPTLESLTPPSPR